VIRLTLTGPWSTFGAYVIVRTTSSESFAFLSQMRRASFGE